MDRSKGFCDDVVIFEASVTVLGQEEQSVESEANGFRFVFFFEFVLGGWFLEWCFGVLLVGFWLVLGWSFWVVLDGFGWGLTGDPVKKNGFEIQSSRKKDDVRNS